MIHTPRKQQLLTSEDYALWDSIVSRFKKMKSGDTVLIGSYTFNHKSLVEAMCKAAKDKVNVSLYMDAQSLLNIKDKIYVQIKDLIEAGAKVYVYATASSCYLFHAKFAVFDRKNRQDSKENKKIVIFGSRNACEGKEAYDVMIIDPDNARLLGDYKDALGDFVVEKPDVLKGKKSAEDLKKFNKKHIRRFVLLEKKEDIQTIIDFLSLYSKSKNKKKSATAKKIPFSNHEEELVDDANQFEDEIQHVEVIEFQDVQETLNTKKRKRDDKKIVLESDQEEELNDDDDQEFPDFEVETNHNVQQLEGADLSGLKDFNFLDDSDDGITTCWDMVKHACCPVKKKKKLYN